MYCRNTLYVEETPGVNRRGRYNNNNNRKLPISFYHRPPRGLDLMYVHIAHVIAADTVTPLAVYNSTCSSHPVKSFPSDGINVEYDSVGRSVGLKPNPSRSRCENHIASDRVGGRGGHKIKHHGLAGDPIHRHGIVYYTVCCCCCCGGGPRSLYDERAPEVIQYTTLRWISSARL